MLATFKKPTESLSLSILDGLEDIRWSFVHKTEPLVAFPTKFCILQKTLES